MSVFKRFCFAAFDEMMQFWKFVRLVLNCSAECHFFACSARAQRKSCAFSSVIAQFESLPRVAVTGGIVSKFVCKNLTWRCNFYRVNKRYSKKMCFLTTLYLSELSEKPTAKLSLSPDLLSRVLSDLRALLPAKSGALDMHTHADSVRTTVVCVD